MNKQLNSRVFESKKSVPILIKLHIICFRMQRVNLHTRASIILHQLCHLSLAGCVHWSMQMSPGKARHNSEMLLGTLRQRQNGWHVEDRIFKCIFLNENIWSSIDISLKFVPKGQIDNFASLVHNGLAPTRRQSVIWTNDERFTDAYMCHSATMS